MTHRRFFPRVLLLLGLVLIVLILTMVMLTFAQAKGSAASIAVGKQADPTVVRAGDTVNYVITVDNDGDSDLTDVIVDDDLAGCTLTGPSGDNGNAILEPDETWTYNCSITAGSEDIVNTATVAATDETSATVTGSAQAEVDVIHPDIEIYKQAEPSVVRPGDVVNYSITVDNAGDSDLTNVTVNDDLDGCTLVGPDGDNGNLVLELDETWTYTCSLTAGDEDILNRATVIATDETGGAVGDAAQEGVDVIHPAIEIAKTPDTQTVSYDSTVTFTIVVTNSSDDPLKDVTVSDAQASNCSKSLGTLPADRSTSYECTRDRVRDGFINSATVTGTPRAGEDVTDVDAAKVKLDETLTCPADLIAYWRLDETSGAPYDDFYYGNDGECAGTCPSSVAGHVNWGQMFNGSNTGIDVPVVSGDDSFDWGAQDGFSIEYWLQTDSASTCSGNQVVVGRDDSSTYLHWWTGCRDGGRVGFYLVDTSGRSAGVRGVTDVTDGAWHHVVAVREASADEIHIYVDGEEEDTESATFSAGFDSSTAALSIGWLNLNPYYRFDGIVDEVALYDGALSADEIRQHYNEGLAGRWYCQPGTYAPIIVSTPVTEARSGLAYSYDVEAVGNPTPAYTLSVQPDGMDIDPSTGLISWVPTVAQEGRHDVTVQASNGIEPNATQDFSIVVHEGVICPADMIAYWKLNEAGDTTYRDFYDGHHGECAGDCPAPTTGHVDGGQWFGSATGIDVPADAAFDWGASDSFSIEFWMKRPGTPTANEVMVGRQGPAPDDWPHIWVGVRQTGGVAAFCLYDVGGSGRCISGGTAVTGEDWHHIAAVRDAVANENRLYVDGVEEASEAETYSADFESPTALNIGWLNLPDYYHFHGILDEVALYDRALSTTEIQRHYNDREASPGYCINPDIAVEKTANAQVVHSEDVVTYTYTVINPGDDPLSSITVRDDKCSSVSSPEGDDDSDDWLDLSETWTYLCAMELVTDTINTVTVTGTHLYGQVSATGTLSVRVVDRVIYLPMLFNLE